MSVSVIIAHRPPSGEDRSQVDVDLPVAYQVAVEDQDVAVRHGDRLAVLAAGLPVRRRGARCAALHRGGGTSQSPAPQQSSIWSMSENHSIHEPHGSGL